MTGCVNVVKHAAHKKRPGRDQQRHRLVSFHRPRSVTVDTSHCFRRNKSTGDTGITRGSMFATHSNRVFTPPTCLAEALRQVRQARCCVPGFAEWRVKLLLNCQLGAGVVLAVVHVMSECVSSMIHWLTDSKDDTSQGADSLQMILCLADRDPPPGMLGLYAIISKWQRTMFHIKLIISLEAVLFFPFMHNLKWKVLFKCQSRGSSFLYV